MIVNAICPIIEYQIENLITWIEKRSDQKWVWNSKKAKYTTKCTNVMQFIEIHGGVEHELHVKYAEVLTVVFVVLMYGPGLPILYIVAVFHYFIYFNMARYSLIYSIMLPPSMGYALTRNCIKFLKWAPILYLVNAYWMLSNK